jgi:ribosomal protein S26
MDSGGGSLQINICSAIEVDSLDELSQASSLQVLQYEVVEQSLQKHITSSCVFHIKLYDSKTRDVAIQG